MRLAAKLILFVILGIAICLAVDGYVSLRRQQHLFEEDMRHDIRILGLTIRQQVTDTNKTSGRARALRIVEDANGVEPSVDIRWVWLDTAPGDACAPRVSRDRLESVVQGRDSSYRQRNEKGDGYFYAYFPLPMETQRPAAIEIRESLAQLDALDRGAFIKIISLTGSLVLFSGCTALLLGVKLIGHPLDHVVRKMRRVGAGDFSGPLVVSGHDELGEVAAGLNAMCEQLDEARDKLRSETEARIAALNQLRHDDRLKTVGRLASGIAHEMGTPLNVISGYAGMIAEGHISSHDISETARTIQAQSERIAHTIRQLLGFARRQPGHRTVTDLRPLVCQTLDLLDPLAQQRKVKVVLVEGAAVARVRVDVEQIKQVLLNLVANALHATPPGDKKVEVAIVIPDPEREQASSPAGEAEAAHGPHVCISVRDEGAGISEEDLNHIFEPFFTTKGPGEGTGLGLTIAEGIVREHGGRIVVASTPGKGSCFSVYLPIEGEPCPDES